MHYLFYNKIGGAPSTPKLFTQVFKLTASNCKSDALASSVNLKIVYTLSSESFIMGGVSPDWPKLFTQIFKLTASNCKPDGLASVFIPKYV